MPRYFFEHNYNSSSCILPRDYDTELLIKFVYIAVRSDLHDHVSSNFTSKRIEAYGEMRITPTNGESPIGCVFGR